MTFNILRLSPIVFSLIALTACGGPPARDYESSARCREQGLAAGTPAFEDCVREESAARMLKQQREEYERHKQEEEFWRTQRY